MVKKIAITGCGGQIAYNLLFRIANGDIFGKEEVELRLCDLPEMEATLVGVAMELQDCAFPLLKKIEFGHKLPELFDKVDLALLVGAKPRGKGMERKDLLHDNGKIFVANGRALNDAAAVHAKVVVVGNPCNTNCLIAMHHAPRLAKKNFHAMMRLDQNRATALLAEKSGSSVKDVKKMVIWGNHSSTQVPDYNVVQINKKPAQQVIGDQSWLQQEFMEQVQKRGAEIIAKRGKSSAASAASSLVDAVRDLYQPTEEGDLYSSALLSDGNPYGIEEGLIFGFPLRTTKGGENQIVEGLSWDYFIKEKIALTQKELLDERACVQELLRG